MVSSHIPVTLGRANGFGVLFSVLLCLAVAAVAQNTSDPAFNKGRTLSLGIVVFPGFEPLDVFGPLEIFFLTSLSHKMTLSLIASTIGPVTSTPPPHRMTPDGPSTDTGYMLRPSIIATHTFADAPALDILLVPGGMGVDVLAQANNTSVEDFIRRRYDQGLDYLLSVCTGAILLARSGVLEGRRATSNKGAWAGVTRTGKNVTWVPTARWVVDGNVWTSSGVSAGMDMAYAFLSHIYGKDDEALIKVMNAIEYAPHADPSWDAFSVVHKVPGADPKANVADCVKPVGF